MASPFSVRVPYRTLAGEAAEELASGFRAAIFQDGIGQIEGVLPIDRSPGLKRDRLLKLPSGRDAAEPSSAGAAASTWPLTEPT